MIQLYFLSVLCNGLAGFILFAGDDKGIESAPFSISNPTFNLVLGILSAVTGILKLLSPLRNGLFILGDLLPAAAGIVSGLILIFGINRQSADSKTGELDHLGTNLLVFRRPIALGLMITAVVHFIFGELIFL